MNKQFTVNVPKVVETTETNVTLEDLGLVIPTYRDTGGKNKPMVFKWDSPRSNVIGAVYYKQVVKVGKQNIPLFDTIRLPICTNKDKTRTFVGDVNFKSTDSDGKVTYRPHISASRVLQDITMQVWLMVTMGEDVVDKVDTGESEVGTEVESDAIGNAKF